MVNDRGHIKWTSLMLPEHIEMLNKLWESDDEMEDIPVVSEDELEEMQRNVEEAIHYNKKVDILYYHNKRIYAVEGFVVKILPDQIKLNTDEGIDFIRVLDVISLSIVQEDGI
ncbi:YolD-like family protein [Gracilibacillus dipsosauri]|uniref:YolD-like family protein n=1 Tax=Gracilibacillus dipsosauri TaxID=178340 RepID=A0A317KZ21_9BACI|nr:YolD-like family protein [Gracilibacillus dipsosauri]PWU68334.1 YolD-like family protein [Gracilibacillus dipsosauri]